MSTTSDLTAEITFLRYMTASKLPDTVRAKYMASVDKSYFGFILTREIYNRVMAVVRNSSYVPTMLELMTDPALSEEARQLIHDRYPKSIKYNMSELRSLANTLSTYRQIRIMLSVAKNLAETLSQPKDPDNEESIDYDELLEKATAKLNTAKMAGTQDETLYHFGLKDNAKELVNTVLTGAADLVYKTGFEGFDDRAGGLPSEGVVIIAATTSGGKSTICNIVLKNLYLLNKLSVVKVTLEMSERQETRRLLSHLSQISHDKFLLSKLTPGEKQLAKKKYREFKQFGVDNNCRFTIWSPKTCTSLDKILLMLQPYQYKVIAIDYISLLNESSSQDQWKVLMDLSMRCKAYSRKNNCLIIMLAQLDEDSEKVRYARAIKENADILWSWTYHKKEQRDARILTINNSKGRDIGVFSFYLMERFDVMSVEDIDQESVEAMLNDNPDGDDDSSSTNSYRSKNSNGGYKSKSSKTSKSKGRTRKPKQDYSQDYDDGIDEDVAKASSSKQAKQEEDELNIDCSEDGMY